MIEKVDILQHSEGSHLGFHSGEEAASLLGIVAYHHEVVIQLRKSRFIYVGGCHHYAA